MESEKIELKQPIFVTLDYSQQDKIWTVDCLELDIYGSGRDEDEAIKDFKIVLEEKYFDLKEDSDKLGPTLRQEWYIFSKIILEK